MRKVLVLLLVLVSGCAQPDGSAPGTEAPSLTVPSLTRELDSIRTYVPPCGGTATCDDWWAPLQVRPDEALRSAELHLQVEAGLTGEATDIVWRLAVADARTMALGDELAVVLGGPSLNVSLEDLALEPGQTIASQASTERNRPLDGEWVQVSGTATVVRMPEAAADWVERNSTQTSQHETGALVGLTSGGCCSGEPATLHFTDLLTNFSAEVSWVPVVAPAADLNILLRCYTPQYQPCAGFENQIKGGSSPVTFHRPNITAGYWGGTIEIWASSPLGAIPQEFEVNFEWSQAVPPRAQDRTT